jgi:hypothetical protein
MIATASALVLVASACSSTRTPCGKGPSLGGESAREEVPSSKLRLSIHSVEPAKGHRIDLEVKIQNVSKEFLWIPHGLALGPLNQATLSLDVRDGAGSRPGWACAEKTLPPAPPRYILLPPRSYYGTIVNTNCAVPPYGGPWLATARFRNAEIDPPPAPPGATEFRGEVVSNTVELNVFDASPQE